MSSTLAELAEERAAVSRAISALRLTPVLFELGTRPHPPRELYRAYAVRHLAYDDVMGTPASKNLRCWCAVAANDETIPPDAERLFAQRMGATTVELVSGHVGMVSHPEGVTNLIKTAAQAVAA